jgi:hypothetical protein
MDSTPQNGGAVATQPESTRQRLRTAFDQVCALYPAPPGRRWTVQALSGGGRHRYFLALQGGDGSVTPVDPARRVYALSEMAAYLEGLLTAPALAGRRR